MISREPFFFLPTHTHRRARTHTRTHTHRLTLCAMQGGVSCRNTVHSASPRWYAKPHHHLKRETLLSLQGFYSNLRRRFGFFLKIKTTKKNKKKEPRKVRGSRGVCVCLRADCFSGWMWVAEGKAAADWVMCLDDLRA